MISLEKRLQFNMNLLFIHVAFIPKITFYPILIFLGKRMLIKHYSQIHFHSKRQISEQKVISQKDKS